MSDMRNNPPAGPGGEGGSEEKYDPGGKHQIAFASPCTSTEPWSLTPPGPQDSQVEEYAWRAEPATNSLSDPEAVIGTAVTKVQFAPGPSCLFVDGILFLQGGCFWNPGALPTPGPAGEDEHDLRLWLNDGVRQEFDLGSMPRLSKSNPNGFDKNGEAAGASGRGARPAGQ
jgi:hypothetical protein